MAVGFKTYGHKDKFWNLWPMPSLGHKLHPEFCEAFQNEQLFIQLMIEMFKYGLKTEQQGLDLSPSPQQYSTKLLVCSRGGSCYCPSLCLSSPTSGLSWKCWRKGALLLLQETLFYITSLYTEWRSNSK